MIALLIAVAAGLGWEEPPTFETPYHQRILSLFVAPASLIARIRRVGMDQAVTEAEARHGTDWVNSVLSANYLPEDGDELSRLMQNPAVFVADRLDGVIYDLERLGIQVESTN